MDKEIARASRRLERALLDLVDVGLNDTRFGPTPLVGQRLFYRLVSEEVDALMTSLHPAASQARSAADLLEIWREAGWERLDREDADAVWATAGAHRLDDPSQALPWRWVVRGLTRWLNEVWRTQMAGRNRPSERLVAEGTELAMLASAPSPRRFKPLTPAQQAITWFERVSSAVQYGAPIVAELAEGALEAWSHVADLVDVPEPEARSAGRRLVDATRSGRLPRVPAGLTVERLCNASIRGDQQVDRLRELQPPPEHTEMKVWDPELPDPIALALLDAICPGQADPAFLQALRAGHRVYAARWPHVPGPLLARLRDEVQDPDLAARLDDAHRLWAARFLLRSAWYGWVESIAGAHGPEVPDEEALNRPLQVFPGAGEPPPAS